MIITIQFNRISIPQPQHISPPPERSPLETVSFSKSVSQYLFCFWWECKLVQPVWKTVWRFHRKLKIELPFDPAIPLLGIYPEKTTTHKDTRTPMFIAALFTIAKTWKQPKCPSTEEWIQKMWYIYIHNGILLHHKKEQNNAICSNIDGTRDSHTK